MTNSYIYLIARTSRMPYIDAALSRVRRIHSRGTTIDWDEESKTAIHSGRTHSVYAGGKPEAEEDEEE